MDENYNINQGIPSFGQPPFGSPPIDMPPFGQPPFDRPPLEDSPSPGAPIGVPPTTSPPPFVPQRPFPLGAPGTFFVDPGVIRPCLGRFVYLWLTSGQEFWAWLVFIGPNSIVGWRWTGFNWVYFGTNVRNIDAFVCY